MTTLELIRKLRDIAKVGVVNARDDIRIQKQRNQISVRKGIEK